MHVSTNLHVACLSLVLLLLAHIPFVMGGGSCTECAICRGDVPSSVTNFMRYLNSLAYDGDDFDGDNYGHRSLQNVNRFKSDALTNATLMELGTNCSKEVSMVSSQSDGCFFIDFIIKDETNSYAETYCSIMTIQENLFNHTLDDDGDNITESDLEDLLEDTDGGDEVSRGFFLYDLYEDRQARFSASFCGFTHCNSNYSIKVDTLPLVVYMGEWMENYTDITSDDYMALETSMDRLMLEMYKLFWAHSDATGTNETTRILGVTEKNSMAKVEFEMDILHTHFPTRASFTKDQVKYVYKLALKSAKSIYSNDTLLMEASSKVMTSVEAAAPGFKTAAGLSLSANVQLFVYALVTFTVLYSCKF